MQYPSPNKGRKMSLPYFPMFPSDFEAKTSHLTLEEDGAYNRLLRIMWMTPGCSLPDDNAWIQRRMRVDSDIFERVVLVVIEEFCERKNGRVSNAKLTEVFEESCYRHKKRVDAGSKGGKAKALKSKETDSSKALAKLKQPKPNPEPYKKDTNVSQKDGLFDEVEMPKTKAPKKSRMVEGWTPNQKNIEDAYSEHLTDDDIQEIANDFQIYWADRTDKSASKSQRGWDQAWRNRCRDIAPKIIRNRRMASNQSANGYGQGGGLAGAYARRHLGG